MSVGGCTLTVLEAGPVSVQQITVLCGSDSRSEDQRMTQTPIDEYVSTKGRLPFRTKFVGNTALKSVE